MFWALFNACLAGLSQRVAHDFAKAAFVAADAGRGQAVLAEKLDETAHGFHRVALAPRRRDLDAVATPHF